MSRILMVDDENNIRLMVRLALQSAGHEIVTAADGADGLEKFGDGEAFHLVLLDQRMPGLDGLAVLREMRGRQPQVRVIMITAFGTIDLAAAALQAGATGFLRKPFTMDVLRGAVGAVLQDNAPRTPALSFTCINGYRISGGTSTSAPAPDAAIHTSFTVHGPQRDAHPCEVVLSGHMVDSITAHTQHHAASPNDPFWRNLCEESLANYLWQNAEPPPGGVLHVDELTSGLRRWIDGVLAES